jgi:hypothetical protein
VPATTSRKVSESRAFQGLPLALEIFHRVFVENVVAFKEAVDFITGLKAEEAPQVGLMQVALPVCFGGEGFERLPREIAARQCHATGNIVRDVNAHFHETTLPRHAEGVKPDCARRCRTFDRSIGVRLIERVDDKDVDWGFASLQLEAELLLHGAEEIGVLATPRG